MSGKEAVATVTGPGGPGVWEIFKLPSGSGYPSTPLVGCPPPSFLLSYFDTFKRNHDYRHGFLTSLFRRRLGILAAQGEGL